MMQRRSIGTAFVALVCLALLFGAARLAFAQDVPVSDNPELEEPDEFNMPQPLLPRIFPPPAEPRMGEGETGTTPAAPTPPPPPTVAPEDRIEGGAAREGENRWEITITAAILMNYVFADSPDAFTIKYTLEIKGQANAATAVITGEADVTAKAEGPLSKWPTGECQLDITIPKVPFEITFRRTDEEKSNLRLIFRRVITEDWLSKCSFVDAPGARFETRGAPEQWLNKALDKARPPLRDIVADVGREEKTTRFVISKEIIADPPLGSGEIEGTGVITIKPMNE